VSLDHLGGESRGKGGHVSLGPARKETEGKWEKCREGFTRVSGMKRGARRFEQRRIGRGLQRGDIGKEKSRSGDGLSRPILV